MLETVWFCIIVFSLGAYVVLDGFDLGAGVIHLFVARTEEERRTVMNAIGPVWDGNEVWLLSAGGAIFLAFPLLFASSFSGFYLPLMIVLWLLMLRALGIELRHQLQSSMWKSFWDVTFSVASTLLTIFFGAALGNVVRGVPIRSDGYFFAPLWTTFTVVPDAGILDWFTLLFGLVSLCTLTTHGAFYIALKTEGHLQARAFRLSDLSRMGTAILSLACLAGTWWIHPDVWDKFLAHAWGWMFPVMGLAGLAGMFVYGTKRNARNAFLASSLFILGMLAATAFGMFPNLLPSSVNPTESLTIYNTHTSDYAMQIGLRWWSVGIVFALGYFVFIYRAFKGKVVLTNEGEGY